MMHIQPICKEPARLHRLGYITVWLQAAVGALLLVQTWPSLTHGIFAVLLATVLL